jgi:hypothetical protein
LLNIKNILSEINQKDPRKEWLYETVISFGNNLQIQGKFVNISLHHFGMIPAVLSTERVIPLLPRMTLVQGKQH